MTADPLDYTQKMQEQVTALRIEAIRNRGRELHPVGSCYFCGEPVGPEHLFCDADCSYDYERSK